MTSINHTLPAPAYYDQPGVPDPRRVGKNALRAGDRIICRISPNQMTRTMKKNNPRTSQAGFSKGRYRRQGPMCLV